MKLICIGCKQIKLPKIDIAESEGVCVDCYQSRIPCCGPLDPLLSNHLEQMVNFIKNIETEPIPECLNEHKELKKLVLTLGILSALEANNDDKFWELVRVRDGLEEHKEKDERRILGFPHPEDFFYKLNS